MLLLEDMAEYAEADCEDEFLEVTLRQYHKALEKRDLVDDQCEREEECIRNLRASVLELERDAARQGRHQTRGPDTEQRGLLVASGSMATLEKHIPQLEADDAMVSAELQATSKELADSTARNVVTRAKINSLEKLIHDESIAGAAGMAHLKATGDLGKYKVLKQQERNSADEMLKDAQDRRKLAEQKMEHTIARKREACRLGLEQLQGEYRLLQTKFKEKQLEVENALANFSAEQSNKIEAMQRSQDSEMKRLDELMQQKASALESEVKFNQRRLAETEEKTELGMEDQRHHLQLEFKARQRLLHARGNREIERQLQTTKEITERGGKWLKQAERMKMIYVSATADLGQSAVRSSQA